MTIGYVFKAEYFLPENASNVLDILADPFMPTTRPLTGGGRKQRSINVENNVNKITDDFNSSRATYGFDDLQQQKYEKYSVPAMVVDSAPNEIPTDDDEEDEEVYKEQFQIEEEQANKQYSLEDLKIKHPNNLATARFTVYKGLEQIMLRLVLYFLFLYHKYIYFYV